MLANYYILGSYDFVIIVDLSTEEAMVKLLFEVGKGGTISTKTLVGIPPELIYKVEAEL